MKRQFSVETLARQIGLVRHEVENVDELDDNFGLSFSLLFSIMMFRNGPVPLPVPSSQLGVIDTIRTIEHAYDALDEADNDNELLRCCFGNLRRSLSVLLIADSVYISEKITGIGDPENADAPDVTYLDTEIFLLLLAISLWLAPIEFEQFTCKDRLPYVCEHRLVSGRVISKPVLQFSAVEVMDCFQLLAQNWHQLHYSSQLTDYIDILMCRLAALFFVPQPNEQASGRSEFEQPFDVNHFTLRFRVVRNIGWAVKSMWKKLRIHQWLIELHEEPIVLPVFSDADRNTLLQKCLFVDREDDLQRPFLNFCLNYLLLPGELEHFKAERPFKDPRVDRVLKFRKGYTKILASVLDFLGGPVRNVVTETELLGSCIADLALAWLASLYLSNRMGIQFTEYFIIFYDWLDKNSHQLQRQLSTRTFPLIMQSFNWIGVYYDGRFYEHASLLNSLLHWMSIIVKAPFHYSVDGISILSLELNDYEFYRSFMQEQHLRL
jgi:hypothetical protein